MIGAALLRVIIVGEMNAPINPREAGRPIFAACLSAEDAARLLGWPLYFLPLLVRARHLKPLGKPAQNSRKWFARVELEALAQDRAWLDKAIQIVARSVKEANELSRFGKPGSEPAAEL